MLRAQYHKSMHDVIPKNGYARLDSREQNPGSSRAGQQKVDYSAFISSSSAQLLGIRMAQCSQFLRNQSFVNCAGFFFCLQLRIEFQPLSSLAK